jgi:hypothetical protein
VLETLTQDVEAGHGCASLTLADLAAGVEDRNLQPWVRSPVTATPTTLSRVELSESPLTPAGAPDPHGDGGRR